MAVSLVVEDGTAKTNSNAYDDTTTGQQYMDDMGYTETLTDETLIRGARTLDALVGLRLKGIRKTAAQAMNWPRSSATDEHSNLISDTTVPEKYKQAAIEMARIVDTNSSWSAGVWIEKIKAGSVALELEIPLHARQTINYVNDLVRPFIMQPRVSR